MTELPLRLLEHGIAALCLLGLAMHHLRVLRAHAEERKAWEAELSRVNDERVRRAEAEGAIHAGYADRYGRTALSATEVAREAILTVESIAGGES